MNNHIRILGIAGSLRQESFNRGVLRAAVELAPEGPSIEIFELDSRNQRFCRSLLSEQGATKTIQNEASCSEER